MCGLLVMSCVMLYDLLAFVFVLLSLCVFVCVDVVDLLCLCVLCVICCVMLNALFFGVCDAHWCLCLSAFVCG